MVFGQWRLMLAKFILILAIPQILTVHLEIKDMAWDYIAVRKLANTEPDFSSVSTEEANTAGSAAQAARRGVIMMM